jgi:glycosyltransferase involved in cell wall biosynthesis
VTARPTPNPPASAVQQRLLFVLPSLGGGGAERASVDLLRGIHRERFLVSLALFSCSGSFVPQVPPDVQVHDLRGGGQNDPRLVWRLADLLRREQPDVVLSVLRYANLVTLLARRLSGSRARVVVNEQNLPSAEFALFGGGAVKSWAIRRLYPEADRTTAISRGIARELTSRYGVPDDRVVVIHNPVDIARVQALAAKPPQHPWLQPTPGFAARRQYPLLVAVGRLHPQKGFAYLIRAFAQVRKIRPCSLIILGEGPERANLERLIAALALGSDVALPGFYENPYSVMRHATLFVLSSIYEGFGNVLVEALALGTPVISTRCPVGPDEIITDGVHGLLIPPANEDALTQVILGALADDELRSRLSANGPARASDFSLERIVEQYESEFERLAAGV